MSLRYGLNTARDLFEKLRRDSELLDEEVTSDRMFNLVITARHLPEWIEKDTELGVPEEQLAELRDSDLYKVCRDIADSSKHFGLRSNRADSTRVNHVSSERGYGIGRYGKGGYGVGEEQITIHLEGGKEIDALDFVKQLIDRYSGFF